MGRLVLTDHQRDSIRRSIDDGLSYREASEKANCKMSTAKSYARRVKLKSPRTLLWDTQHELARDGKRLCPQCKRVLPLTSFRLYDGRVKYSYCLECCRENNWARISTPRLRFQRIANAARNRAESKLIPFDIDAEYIGHLWDQQGGLCAYSGEPMTAMRNSSHTVSIDRIVPARGYVRGNVTLCCDVVNKMKWEMDDKELLAWCKKIVGYLDQNA